MDSKSREWLKTEADGWVNEGIITSEQCETIKQRYPVQKVNNPLVTFFAVIGSLLIGAGIILVFATNWWLLPVWVRVVIAFLPLLLAQGICIYTYRRKFDSAPYREGCAVFLSLSFFAVLALVGQIFHTPGDMGSYLLTSLLLSLPAAYIFRARSVMTIYVVGCLSCVWEWSGWIAIGMLVIALPFFYRELVCSSHRRSRSFLLLLLSVLTCSNVLTIAMDSLNKISGEGIAVLCVLLLLLNDAAFRNLAPDYFFTPAKLLAIGIATVTLLVMQFDFYYASEYNPAALVASVIIAVVYLLLRRRTFTGLASGDIFFAASVLLLLCADFAGIAACLLAVALGIYYIVLGSKSLALSNINYGMAMVVLVIAIRFFDSYMGLLVRGLVFILLGAVFLGINLYISRKRKELQR